jgi:hypothetical protein
MDLDWMKGQIRSNLGEESENKKISRAAPAEDLRPNVQFGTDCQLGGPLSFVSWQFRGDKRVCSSAGSIGLVVPAPLFVFVVFVSKSFLLLPHSMEIRHPRRTQYEYELENNNEIGLLSQSVQDNSWEKPMTLSSPIMWLLEQKGCNRGTWGQTSFSGEKDN